MWNQFRVLLFLIFISIPCHSSTQDQNLVTYAFATYNTHFLSACMAKQRQSNFQLVVDELSSVNVVALQEVRDRLAVEYYFKPEHWTIVIDDDSTDDMNLAFAIRKGTQFRLESGNLTNADHVLDFAFSKDNENFTDERRVLKLYVSTELGEILVLNHHAKSRYNGRSITDRQRVNASLDLVAFIEGSSEQNVILLVAHEAVSYGLKSTATTGEFFKKINPFVPGSRWANIDNFDTDQANTYGLYDQIFISRKLEEAFAKQWHIHVFEHPAAIQGNNDTRASDHVPVIARLGSQGAAQPNIKIVSLLPNPIGSDSKRETVTVMNHGSSYSGGLILRDLSGRSMPVTVDIPSQQMQTITITSGVTLNNTGYTISLLDEHERLLDSVNYASSKEGIEINF